MSEKKPRSLFSKEAIEALRKERFTGNIMVKWDNGMINDMELQTDTAFRRQEDFC